jgi:hypothetical protein
MPVSISGTNGVTFPDNSLQTAAASPFGLKNRIINGDMVISQRNGTSSVTPVDGQYTLDRWLTVVTQTSKLSIQQNAGSVTPPTGFTNYLGVTSLSAYSIAASDFFTVRQYIEGFNTADLAWGTANARTVTLSFWVRSSLTGTFGGVIFNSAANRTYVFSYTISAANTWEQKTITITGDTTGTWLTNNGIGLAVDFTLASGSNFTRSAGSWSTSGFAVTGTTSVVGTNGATFYITGVQLERNTTATPFEWLPYTTELQLCQRYTYRVGATSTFSVFGGGFAGTTTNAYGLLNIPVTMRSKPTLTSSGSFRLSDTNSGFSASVLTPDTNVMTLNTIELAFSATGLTQYRPYEFQANNDANAFLLLSAEL